MIRVMLGYALITFACLMASSPWGIHTQAMSKELLDSCGLNANSGVIVISVDDESPAKGLVKRGDVITEINNRKLQTPRELNFLGKTALLGKPVNVKVWRKNAFIDVHFTPIVTSEPTFAAINDPILGDVKLIQTKDGVMVSKVNRQGLFQKGDKILEINNQKIMKASDVKKALEADKASLSIALDRKGAQIVQSFSVNNKGSFFSQTIISGG